MRFETEPEPFLFRSTLGSPPPADRCRRNGLHGESRHYYCGVATISTTNDWSERTTLMLVGRLTISLHRWLVGMVNRDRAGALWSLWLLMVFSGIERSFPVSLRVIVWILSLTNCSCCNCHAVNHMIDNRWSMVDNTVGDNNQQKYRQPLLWLNSLVPSFPCALHVIPAGKIPG